MLRFRIESFDYTDIVLRALEGHKRIFHAIEKADVEEVGRAVHYHLDRSLRDILKLALQGRIEK
jgi:DNA-binding GntR family transcriptional regulator